MKDMTDDFKLMLLLLATAKADPDRTMFDKAWHNHRAGLMQKYAREIEDMWGKEYRRLFTIEGVPEYV